MNDESEDSDASDREELKILGRSVGTYTHYGIYGSLDIYFYNVEASDPAFPSGDLLIGFNSGTVTDESGDSYDLMTLLSHPSFTR